MVKCKHGCTQFDFQFLNGFSLILDTNFIKVVNYAFQFLNGFSQQQIVAGTYDPFNTNFQFLNGFSLISLLDPSRLVLPNFQFLNGFSLSDVTTTTIRVFEIFQFLNGFSQDITISIFIYISI